MKKWVCVDLTENEKQGILEQIKFYRRKNKGRTYINWVFHNRLWIQEDAWDFFFWYQEYVEEYPKAVESFDCMFNAWCVGRYVERESLIINGWAIV